MFRLLTRTAVFALGVAIGAASYAQTSPPSTTPAAPAAKDTLNQDDQTFVKEAGWSVSTTLIQPGSEFRLRVLVSLSVASGRPASNEEVQPVDLWTTQAR